MTRLRYNPPRTPGGYFPPASWQRKDIEATEDLAKIIAQRQRKAVGAGQPAHTVRSGSRVRVRECNDARTVTEYEIVELGEANPAVGRISIGSPMGVALLGTRAGHTVDVETPRGVSRLRVLEVS